jgi:hypothetical protein
MTNIDRWAPQICVVNVLYWFEDPQFFEVVSQMGCHLLQILNAVIVLGLNLLVLCAPLAWKPEKHSVCCLAMRLVLFGWPVHCIVKDDLRVGVVWRGWRGWREVAVCIVVAVVGVGGFGGVGGVGVVDAVGAVGAVGEIGGWHGVCLCLFVLYVLEEENEDHSCRLNHQAKWLRVVLALEVLVSVFHRGSNFYPLNGQLLTYDCICQCCSYVEGRFLLVVNLFVDLL